MRENNLQEKDFSQEELSVPRKKLARKTIGEEGSRRQTMIGLIVTIILGLFFYLPTQVGNWFNDWDFEETITIERPVGDARDVSEVLGFEVEIRTRNDAEGVVKELLAGKAGEYGVWVKKLDADEGIYSKDSQVYTAASVIKLPLLTAYYLAVEKGSIDPEETYSLAEEDRWEYGTGSMQNAAEGTKYSYRKIAQLVANQSDNMGAEVLIEKLGGYAAVQKTITGLGMVKTNVKENETTPKEMGELLVKIETGKLLKEESRQEMFANLTDTVLETRLPAGVPSGVRVVHKFGSEAGVVNDCGIVYGDSKYVACILTTGINDGEAEELMPKLSRLIWEWMSQ